MGRTKATPVQDDNLKLSIPKAPFQRIVNEIFQDLVTGYKMNSEALVLLHKVSEEHMSLLFQEANECAKHSGRDEITTNDVKLAMSIRGYGRW